VRATLAIAAVVALLAGAALAWRSSTGASGPSANDSPGPSAPEAPGPPSAGATARGVQRYVAPTGDDGDRGSRARPWRTLERAVAAARPGMTVNVAPGRYRGRLTITRGGSAKRPVRFVSRRPWRARLSARSTGSIAVVEIRADHVRFEGFDITGSGGDGTAGINVEGSHVAVVGNRVHDLSAPCLESGNGAAGIVFGGGNADYQNHDGLVAANLVERIGRGPLDGSCRLAHGIYAAVPRVRIVNNIVYHAVGDGITSWHAARELTIANNLSTRNGGAGILIGSGDRGATRAGHRGTVVSNNIVHRNALYGITESSDGEHRVGPGNRYLHNLAYANRGGDTSSRSGVGGLFRGAIQSGNLNADPLFADDADARRNYGLQPTSPAVDAGTCAGAPRRDFSGALRPQGPAVDIGPDELRSTPERCP
jgi:pectate disaccharide-lyase